MRKRKDITGAILAGGKSTRMGRDKALLDLKGKPFIQHVAEALQLVFRSVIIISDHGDRYRFLHLPVYQDIFKNCGPLGGIHSALTHVSTEAVFLASCDVPFLSPSIIRYVVGRKTQNDVTLLYGGNSLQPLCGLYKRHCLPTVEHHLEQGRYSVLECLREIHTTVLSPELDGAATESHALMNINTPSDYEHCLKHLSRTGKYSAHPERIIGDKQNERHHRQPS